MSFYVTLPSNASMNVYKNNLISDFRTDLLVPLKLDGPWEVALTKIIYRNSLSTNIGFLDIININDRSINTIPIEIEQSQNLLQAFQSLSTIINHANDLVKGITENKKVIQINVIEFEKSNTSNSIGSIEILLHENFQLSLRGTISSILNVSSTSLFDKNKPFRIELVNEKVLVNEKISQTV